MLPRLLPLLRRRALHAGARGGGGDVVARAARVLVAAQCMHSNNNNNNNNNTQQQQQSQSAAPASSSSSPAAASCDEDAASAHSSDAHGSTSTSTTTTGDAARYTTTSAPSPSSSSSAASDSNNDNDSSSKDGSNHNTRDGTTSTHNNNSNSRRGSDTTAATAAATVRGFEAFYSSSLTSHMLPRHAHTPPTPQALARSFAMSPAERVLTLHMSQRARAQRTLRRLLVVCVALTCASAYRAYRSHAHTHARIDGYAYVVVDVPRHRAAYMDAQHRVLAVRHFVDYDAFVAAHTDGADTSSNNNNDNSNDNNDSDDSSSRSPRDVVVRVTTYYPWLPMLVLCALPLAAAAATAARRSVRAVLQAEQHAAAQSQRRRFRFTRQAVVQTRLDDVAGLVEAKREVVEVVDFLRRPARYHALGARLPRGVLLDGPPGVGKTLLAKAVAGEAGVPFISCSGSEFDEVYVGVGAQRVRALFAEAHACKPCVVFIDEIDAVGRTRQGGGGGGGSSSHSRGTLNAFLAEMDGFKDASGILVLAATNRADVLDKALTRSGRFDRKITLDLPTHADRVDVALVHLRPLRLTPPRPAAAAKKDGDNNDNKNDNDRSSSDEAAEKAARMRAYAETVAALTPGCSGADIFSICNEAAIQAAREGGAYVEPRHLHSAAERVLVGLQRSAVKHTPHERERIAYHEAGIVVVNWFLRDADAVLKTTILPRGRHRSGVTQRLPQSVHIVTQQRLLDQVVGRLAGYATEAHFFADASTRAAREVQRATDVARRMVCEYGMAPDTIGHLGYELDRDDALQKPFGPAKEDAVDAAVDDVVRTCLTRARAMVRAHAAHIRDVAALLLARETLTAHELRRVLGDRPVMTKEFLTYLDTEVARSSHHGDTTTATA